MVKHCEDNINPAIWKINEIFRKSMWTLLSKKNRLVWEKCNRNYYKIITKFWTGIDSLYKESWLYNNQEFANILIIYKFKSRKFISNIYCLGVYI